MFAHVVLNNHFLPQSDYLSYAIPDEMEKAIAVGSLVTVPLRGRKTGGLVIKVLPDSFNNLPHLKSIIALSPYRLPEWQLKMAHLIASQCLCPLSKALQPFFAAAVWEQKPSNADQTTAIVATASTEQIRLYLGKHPLFRQQNALLKKLLAQKLLLAKDWPLSTRRSLIKNGLIKTLAYETAVSKSPLSFATEKSTKHALSAGQKAILDSIMNSAKPLHLLHGLSASGKSEIYLRLALESIRQGGQALILAPEISLIQHLAPYFQAFFPQQFVLLHSRLPLQRKKKIWRQIHSGQIKIVLGSRLALFYPFSHLRLIVMDEAHEWSYKNNQTPRYHSREVVTALAEQIADIKIVLGSATPDLVSYHAALHESRWALHSLDKEHNDWQAQAQSVDMRQEFHRGNKSVFSENLVAAIGDRLSKKEQSLIVINRRGFANTVSCRDCGGRSDCPLCQVPLTLYKKTGAPRLFCHHCGQGEIYHSACRHCGGLNIKEIGVGTERVVALAQNLFPKAKIAQVDGSTLKKKADLAELNQIMAAADIIVGTGIVAKGFDLPRLTLSCVLLADLELNFPDYDSGEKAFQLFAQTRGRVGRHQHGLFLAQSYQPEHPVLQAALANPFTIAAFRSFAASELTIRQDLNLPPFCRLARINIKHHDEAQARNESENLLAILRADQEENEEIYAAPDLIYRKAGLYNWHLIIHSPNPQRLITKAKIKTAGVDISPLSTI